MSVKGKNKKKKSNKQGKYLSKKNVILLSVALLLLFIIILISPLFAISTIDISAVELYSKEEIYSYFAEFKGKNGFVAVFENTTFSQIDGLFGGRLTEKEHEVLFDFPLIKNTEISFDFPNKIDVVLEERTPMMMTEVDEMYLYIDSEGYLLGAYTQKDEIDMPLIKGIEITDYKVGGSIADGSDNNIASAITICSIMKQLSMLSYIDIIDVTDYNDIRMHCAPALTIEFGSVEDVGRKLSYIKGIIDEGYDGESDGVLDISSGGNPIFRENLDEEQIAPEENIGNSEIIEEDVNNQENNVSDDYSNDENSGSDGTSDGVEDEEFSADNDASTEADSEETNENDSDSGD